MASSTNLRRLLPEDWPAFRELRLRALATDFKAFGSSVAHETAYPESRWKEWAEGGAHGDRQATFVAETFDHRLVGMAGIFHGEDDFQVWGMWVEPSFRGQGLATSLLTLLIEWLDGTFPSSPLRLEVNPDQEAAVRTYRKAGFEFTGRRRTMGHSSGDLVVCEMSRPSNPRREEFLRK